MKIAFLNKYQESVNRGAETYVSELSKRLSRKHNVDVVSKIDYLKLIRSKYDVIIPTNGRFQVFITRLITWFTGSKMIVSGQSGIGLDDRLNVYAFPDVFIALSTKALNWAKKTNPFIKSVYIPNGVDLSRFKGNLNLNKKNKVILSVGAFTDQKRHSLVIDAVSLIEGASLVLAGGGGDMKDEIMQKGLAKLGQNRFKIVTTTNEKMPEIYRSANVFTLASKTSESFGIVIAEAMASGLPVVVTDDPIRKEIVGDAGIFVNPENPVEYSEAIKTALNLNWGDKPRKQSKKFDWDLIADEYEKILNTL